nr:MAG TPA: hypothetical protein [Caudoviricetes sp.]DAZ55076.1 MAG TPA: hypothetical protein [Caudoviricetes sp.]
MEVSLSILDQFLILSILYSFYIFNILAKLP